MSVPSIDRAARVLAICFGIGIISPPSHAALIDATAVLETCDWIDPLCWDLDPALATPTAPHNDGTNYFTVLIDGGSAAERRVDLAAAVTVDRVEIDSGDTLQLLGGALLTLQYDTARSGSGAIHNDGMLAIGTADAGARVEFVAPYDPYGTPSEVTGVGAIVLSDRADNFFGAPYVNYDIGVQIALGQGQTLRGAGTVQIATNQGLIEATGINPITLERIRGTISNQGILRALGSGGMEAPFGTDIYNSSSGLIEVADGSHLSGQYGSPTTIENRGTLRVQGANAYASVLLDNTGLVEILDGATLSGYIQHSEFTNPALFRIGPGSTFEGGGEIESGRVRIEGGLIRSGGLEFDGRYASSSRRPRLEGIGRIELSSLAFSYATLAPGLDGVGRLDVDGGGVQFLDRGIFEIDLAGSGDGEHDLLVVSGTTRFEGPAQYGLGNRIDLKYLPGFAPNAGDSIDVLSAGSIVVEGQTLDGMFTLPDLPGDLYFAPEIATEGASQHLRLHFLEPIASTWIGGDGNFQDAAGWSFSKPTAAAIPGNAGLEVFDVHIGGAPGIDSDVALETQATINRLIVDAGDSLTLGAGSRLLLEKPLGRSEAREVRNDGTVALTGGALTAENGLAFSGTGSVQLSDDAANYIGALIDYPPIAISNGVGHTIAGAGSIRTTTTTSIFGDRGFFSNLGTVHATGSNPLLLDAHVVNDGVMIASGAGGFVITDALTQRGQLRVGEGSRLDLGEYGSFRQESDTAVTELGPRAVLSARDMIVDGGRLVLDDGTIQMESDYGVTRIGAGGRLEGNGTIALWDQFSVMVVDDGGAIAPGLSGIGRLEVATGDLYSYGQLQLEIAGTIPDLFDRIEIAGFALFGGTASVSLVDGFTPAPGDAFEIVHSSGMGWNVDLEGGVLGGGLYLVPEIDRDPDGDSLILRMKREITAAWAGPSGDFLSPSWTFSVTPGIATSPSNDDRNIFDVEIGGSGPVDVALGSAARIESLILAAGSTLNLNAGASLTFQRAPDRAQSGRILNDGSILIGSGAGGASMPAEGDIEIDGNGTIELFGTSTLGAIGLGLTPGILTNGAGHAIRGEGEIGQLRNLGLVEATGASALTIRGVENDGALRAIGSGGLVLFSGGSQLLNRGLIESGPGSSVRANGTMANQGDLAISGSFTGSVTNEGLLDLRAGASYSGGILQQTSESAVTRIAGNLTAPRFRDLKFDHGLLELDGGTIGFSERGLLIGPGAVLQGNGATRPQTTLTNPGVQIQGALAPGLDGIGAIEITGAFAVAPSGTLTIELSGSGAPEHDLVTVLGSSVLEGTVVVEILDGEPFAPAVGDAFDILIAQSIAAAGASFVLPALSGDLSWATGVVAVDGIQRLRLLVVPEPGSGLLMLLGLALFARRHTHRVR